MQTRTSRDGADIGVKIFAYGFMLVLAILSLYPLLLTVSTSLSDNTVVLTEGYSLLPRKWSLGAYTYLIQKTSWVFRSYVVSIFVTLVGTILSLAVTAMIGYAISVKTVKYRNKLAFFCYFSMICNAGIVPWYFVCRNFYHLGNSPISLILPYLINPYWMFLARNYFSGIPDEISESAKIDGAAPFQIFLWIILPMSTPVIATVGMFCALRYWNDWFLALMFIRDKAFFPLQYQLYNVLSNVMFLSSGQAVGAESALSGLKLPTETIKMATTVITIGPIVLVYPFIQKYFVRGIMMGAVKG